LRLAAKGSREQLAQPRTLLSLLFCHCKSYAYCTSEIVDTSEPQSGRRIGRDFLLSDKRGDTFEQSQKIKNKKIRKTPNRRKERSQDAPFFPSLPFFLLPDEEEEKKKPGRKRKKILLSHSFYLSQSVGRSVT
jgi:hypothetical protein